MDQSTASMSCVKGMSWFKISLRIATNRKGTQRGAAYSTAEAQTYPEQLQASVKHPHPAVNGPSTCPRAHPMSLPSHPVQKALLLQQGFHISQGGITNLKACSQS